jgi:V/A-type H+-transporting ATPase subunit I
MSIEKMNLVQLTGSNSQLDAALLECCSSGVFHLESPPDGAVTGFRPMQEQNPFSSLLQQAQSAIHLLKIPPEYRDYYAFHESEEELKAYLGQIVSQAQELRQTVETLRSQVQMYEQASTQLHHIKGLSVRIGDLTESQRMTARFGRLPAGNFEKLPYFKRQTFFFFDFDHDKEYYWGVYLAPNSETEEVDRLFNSLYFERIDLPGFLEETPDKAAVQLEERLQQLKLKLQTAEEKLSEVAKEQGEQLLTVYSYVKMRNDTFALRQYATTSHGKFFLEGFVPKTDAKAFVKRFDGYPQILCEILDPSDEPQLEPPVKLKTPKFFKPFELFVTMYGLPDYYGWNPTSLIGFIYILLFGIMFADVGQGFLLAVGGYLLYRTKKLDLAAIISRCGIASMLFGLVFGSVFGFEDLLDPVYESLGITFLPLKVFESKTTNQILYGVVAIGIVIILTTMILNIRLSLRKKNVESAYFSNNGVAGLILYAGVVATVVLMMVFQINILNPIFILVVFVLPVLAMLFREPLANLVQKKPAKPEGGFGAYLLQNIFELLEYAISYLSNTLSFMRVGGFVLSHAGMMLVVKTLAEMVGSGGSIPVYIFGNLFVMALEGFVVAIQVLRLVYYETFSRFYDGTGKPFVPTTVDFSESANNSKG